MRVYGYAAEVLGLSPYWRRRPQLQTLMVLYEASSMEGQAVEPAKQATLPTSWFAIQSYFSQYFQARGQRSSANASLHFVLDICAASNSQVFEARFREGLSDPSLVALLLVYSSASKVGPIVQASEPANPSLLVHRIACKDSANPVSAETRRQVYSTLLASLSSSAGPTQCRGSSSSSLSGSAAGTPC